MTDRAHLSYVRAAGCVVRPTPTDRCFGPVEAHHVRTAANAGMGMRPGDQHAVGLCARHHRALHATGRRTFETLHGLDLAAEAARLAAEDTPPPNPLPSGEGDNRKETPVMLDTTEVADATLDLVRERLRDLEFEARVAIAARDNIADLIARIESRRAKRAKSEAKQGKPDKLRTPAERIAGAHAASSRMGDALAHADRAIAAGTAAMRVNDPATVEGALERLGRAIAARDGLEDAGLSDAHLAGRA